MGHKWVSPGYWPISRERGSTVFTYDNADRVTSITTPNPGTGSQVTSNTYNNMGWITSVRLPDGQTAGNIRGNCIRGHQVAVGPPVYWTQVCDEWEVPDWTGDTPPSDVPADSDPSWPSPRPPRPKTGSSP